MNKKEIAFLDTIVYRSPNHRHSTRIYHKPTDQKQYLYYHSAHPGNEKELVPYGHLIRCRRICTEDHYFEEAKNIQPTEVQEISNQPPKSSNPQS